VWHVLSRDFTVYLHTHEFIHEVKGKGQGHTPDIAPRIEEISLQRSSNMAHVVEGFHSFTCLYTRTFIHEWNESYLLVPSQPKLVFICQPRGMEG